ncbi:hypothetical protein BFP97_00405 [Roseivirga sp. 4D4]|nr:hypothetical protein BFP97_00405 [Roseivirga sp. 4D4]
MHKIRSLLRDFVHEKRRVRSTGLFYGQEWGVGIARAILLSEACFEILCMKKGECLAQGFSKVRSGESGYASSPFFKSSLLVFRIM